MQTLSIIIDVIFAVIFIVLVYWFIDEVYRINKKANYCNYAQPSHPRQIILLNGPLVGRIHEVEDGFPVPNNIGFDENGFLHWYKIDYGCGYWICSNKKLPEDKCS